MPLTLRVNNSDSSSDPPLRHWNIKIFLEGPGKEEIAASVFSNAQYRLHETFEDRMIQGTFGSRSPCKTPSLISTRQEGSTVPHKRERMG